MEAHRDCSSRSSNRCVQLSGDVCAVRYSCGQSDAWVPTRRRDRCRRLIGAVPRCCDVNVDSERRAEQRGDELLDVAAAEGSGTRGASRVSRVESTRRTRCDATRRDEDRPLIGALSEKALVNAKCALLFNYSIFLVCRRAASCCCCCRRLRRGERDRV